jgi:hypothetical protein
VISDDSVPFPRSVIAVRDLPYDDLGLPLAGLLCWDEAQVGPRPGILLIGDVVKNRIDELETERAALTDYITGGAR